MNDFIGLTIAILALGISVYGFYRCRYWARRAEAAAASAEKYADRVRELRDAENIRTIKRYGR